MKKIIIIILCNFALFACSSEDYFPLNKWRASIPEKQNVDSKTDGDWTPLLFASRNGSTAMVKNLLDAYANFLLIVLDA